MSRPECIFYELFVQFFPNLAFILTHIQKFTRSSTEAPQKFPRSSNLLQARGPLLLGKRKGESLYAVLLPSTHLSIVFYLIITTSFWVACGFVGTQGFGVLLLSFLVWQNVGFCFVYLRLGGFTMEYEPTPLKNKLKNCLTMLE